MTGPAAAEQATERGGQGVEIVARVDAQLAAGWAVVVAG